MTYNENNSWLLDGMNEEGLTGGLLMLPEGTSASQAEAGAEGCMGMELVSRLLAFCKNVDEVKEAVSGIQILDIPHEEGSVPASMHYFFVDASGNEAVLEAADVNTPGRLKIYDWKDGIGVMTNFPPYPRQLENLSWYISQSPDLKQGLGEGSIDSLAWDNRIIKGNSLAKHVSADGCFPGGYSSHERFIRLAVFKALNESGNHFSDETMLALGSNLMSTVYEPSSQGLFHYSEIDENGTLKGQKDSSTRYLVMYDISGRYLYMKACREVVWNRYRLEELLKINGTEPLTDYLNNGGLGGVKECSFLDKE